MSETARRLPAEWAPQSGVMLTWPQAEGAFKPWLAAVERCFSLIAREISLREKVLIVAASRAHCEHIQALIAGVGGKLGQVIFQVVPSDDVWARDHGPITVLAPEGPRLLDFIFNGWGGKYAASRDNRITQILRSQGAFGETPATGVEFVLEGGAIESDGAGTLLTTSRCLLHPGRNPGFNRIGIEKQLIHWLGVERVLWLDHGGLAGDDTDGHIDTLARFAGSDTILYQSYLDRYDVNFDELSAMARELRTLRRAEGLPYRLVPLPAPRPKLNEAGQRLPASYANFLIINGAVLVPAYDDPADELARRAVAACFPERETILIDCLPLIYQFGGLHCVTMQLPAGVLASTSGLPDG